MRLKERINLPGIQKGSVSEDTLEGFEGLFARDIACGDLPVIGIKFASGGGAAPHDGNEAHGQRNSTDSVICGSNEHPPADAWAM